MTASPDFRGMTVVAFESRMAQEMTRLIERYGGQPLVAPSMQEMPVEDNPLAFEFGEALLAERFDLVVFLTGVGTKYLAAVLQTRFPLDALLSALRRTTLAARGPKPLGALKALGLTPEIVAPEPNTWRDLLQALDTHYGPRLEGLQVAIQEYGAPNPELLEALTDRGATVTRVPVYRWTLPQDLGPFHRAIETILSGDAEVMLMTNAVQVDHLVQLLNSPERIERFRDRLAQMVVGSIGQMTSERLRHYRFPVDLEPSHSRLGVFVKETGNRAQELLTAKRRFQATHGYPQP